MKVKQKKIEEWNFDNSYTKLPKIFFTKLKPTPACNPKLIIFNRELGASLGIPCEPDVFVGNTIPPGADPLAQSYAGHQFGYFTMLGDGRAILLGEQITSIGERFDIQLKGAGRTPYSRNGDGRAALGPMLREYIISEAMHTLGIKTTRSLAVVTTGESVIREKDLKGAVLTRIASSHIRVGTFEFASYFGTTKEVQSLADYAITRHFPYLTESKNKYLGLLKEVAKRQASLISAWQSVGFIHGVMNTDNMAISGETIDYGPCAFMDVYDPKTVFSSIDTNGRYSFENQPKIAAWNLARFAETLLPLLHEDENKAIELANSEIAEFEELFRNYWLNDMGAKLGLYTQRAGDELLIQDLLLLMQRYKADYINTFRALTLDEIKGPDLFSATDFDHWFKKWQARLGQQNKSKSDIQTLMKNHNPAVIPRNIQVEEALTAAESDDLSILEKLLRILKEPYAYTREQEEYSHLEPSTSRCYQTFCGT